VGNSFLEIANVVIYPSLGSSGVEHLPINRARGAAYAWFETFHRIENEIGAVLERPEVLQCT